jgi:hypothetical protein
MNMIKDIRAGRKNDPEFHTRITGTGIYADLNKKRFLKACKKYNLRPLHECLFNPKSWHSRHSRARLHGRRR